MLEEPDYHKIVKISNIVTGPEQTKDTFPKALEDIWPYSKLSTDQTQNFQQQRTYLPQYYGKKLCPSLGKVIKI